MIYARAFFDLQLRFADTVTALSGFPLARALLEYTNLYVRFGLGRDFDAGHPVWRAYLAGLQNARDPREWTYRFYVAGSGTDGAPPFEATFGCFAYGRLTGDRIRLHFRNAETDGRSPLARECLVRRKAELAALVEHVSARRQPLRVVGASWLYNLDAYRRLFPVTYLATTRVLPRRFQHMPLWGQFLDRRGEVRDGMAREFLGRLGRQSSTAELERCFPFQVLSLEAPLSAFYAFYGIPVSASAS